MTNKNNSIGILLLLIAAVLLLGKLGVFHILGSFLWPLLILIPGLLLHYFYFNRVLPSGVLVPGGILVTYSAMFIYCNLFGWSSMSYLWPGFILGVAIGLYELYLFDRKSYRGVLGASIILGIMSGIFFGITLLYNLGIYMVALILIAAGVLFISRKPRAW